MDNGGQKEKRKFSLSGSFSSDIIDETMVDTLVDWFPDWAFGDTLECLFQASKNGYKYIVNRNNVYSIASIRTPL